MNNLEIAAEYDRLADELAVTFRSKDGELAPIDAEKILTLRASAEHNRYLAHEKIQRDENHRLGIDAHNSAMAREEAQRRWLLAGIDHTTKQLAVTGRIATALEAIVELIKAEAAKP